MLQANNKTENSNAIKMNPFPGLRPFQAEESHLFFGRENYIDTIFSKLNSYHFVSIVGNSGSGKSSLLRAGVIPRLKKQPNWIIATMRPGKSPVEELHHTILEIIQQNPDRQRSISDEEQLNILYNNQLGLVQILRNNLPQGKQLLLVVDQFEELFRFHSEKEDLAHQFVNLLHGAINQRDVNISVIITLRSDFIGECEQFIGLPEAINQGQFLIPRMKTEELQLSITGPIELSGHRISPRLVQQLLKDVGSNPDQLPILQHVLMRTWEVWAEMNEPNAPIDLIHYEKTGKMAKALSNHAEEAMLEIQSEEDQRIIETIFKSLTVKESDNRGVRRPTSIDKLAKIADTDTPKVIQLVNIFRRADRGFLMPPANISINEKSVIDISHESLMRVWDRLDKWVDEEFESAQIYQRITASAQLYEKGLSGLWRDPDLQIALDWNKKYNVTQEWTTQYNEHFELSKQFIDASYQHKMYTLAEKNRRKRLTNIITILVVIALSALSLWAFFERNNSKQNEQMALTEKQNALAQESIAKNQKLIAEQSAIKAEAEKRNAEKQKQFAILKEMEANRQKKYAEQASTNAIQARELAETEKKTAVLQRMTADSLRKVATISEANAYRLRILSIAKTLAVKSASMSNSTLGKSLSKNVKPLLAIQAYNFNMRFGGSTFDQDIFRALYNANKDIHEENYYMNTTHTDMVRSVVFSPNDKEIASCGSDGIMLVCDASQLQKNLRVYPKQNQILENACYDAESRYLACTGDKTHILVFDNQNSQLQPILITGVHSDRINGLGWHKNLLVSISADNTIKLINPQNKNVVNSLNLHATPSAFSIASGIAYIGFEDGTVSEVNLDNLSSEMQLKKLPGKISVIAYSSARKTIAAGINDGLILEFKINQASNTFKNLNQHRSTVTSLAYNLDGSQLVSGSLDGLVLLWNCQQADPDPIPFKEHESWVWSVAFNHKGNEIASGSKDKSLIKFITDENKLVQTVAKYVERNLTQQEWLFYIGKDIPFEKTIPEIN